MKKFWAMMLAMTLLWAWGGMAFGEGADPGVVVKSYAEMLAAVNEQKADRILISSKYNHKSREYNNLEVESGRTVVITSEDGEKINLKGRIDILGEGTVLFEKVNIKAPDGSTGLWIGGGAHVTIGSVTAGKGKEYGCTAVIVDGSHLIIDKATGTDGAIGMGGDGIFAYGPSTVKVRKATGGSAKKGVGGAGVVAFAGAAAEVTGSAVGGDGLYGSGKGALIGLDGTLSGEGKVEDGERLSSGKPVDPTVITNRALLENALRNGETDILIQQKYKSAGDLDDSTFWFCASEEPIRIHGVEGAKRTKLDCQCRFRTGNWILEDLDVSLKGETSDPAVLVDGNAKVTLRGNVTGKGKQNGGVTAKRDSELSITGNLETNSWTVYASNNARVTVEGSVICHAKGGSALCTDENGTIVLTGDLTLTNDSNATYNDGGKIDVTGNIAAKKSSDYPTVWSSAGETNIIGSVTTEGKGKSVYNKGGEILIKGDVSCSADKKYAVELTENAGAVTIQGNLTARAIAARATGGKLLIDGNLIIRSKEGNWALYSTDGEGQIEVTGKAENEKVKK